MTKVVLNIPKKTDHCIGSKVKVEMVHSINTSRVSKNRWGLDSLPPSWNSNKRSMGHIAHLLNNSNQ